MSLVQNRINVKRVYRTSADRMFVSCLAKMSQDTVVVAIYCVLCFVVDVNSVMNYSFRNVSKTQIFEIQYRVDNFSL